ncbi:hypothetical protein NPIL_151021 [Nephila pilipes]|uniref:Uncharacterized protein n=1 Tax=Nephila pilipes TaxID=299642 RepID=A0A8X6NHP1_NEPPI|nr:hypothetical protein NPIL_151021 [Nephila pilipes]
MKISVPLETTGPLTVKPNETDRLNPASEFSEEIPPRVTPKAIRKFSPAEKLLQNEKPLSKNVRKTRYGKHVNFPKLLCEEI